MPTLKSVPDARNNLPHRCVHTDFIAARKSFCTIENRIGMHTGRTGRTVRLILIKHHTIVASTALFTPHCCVSIWLHARLYRTCGNSRGFVFYRFLHRQRFLALFTRNFSIAGSSGPPDCTNGRIIPSGGVRCQYLEKQ